MEKTIDDRADEAGIPKGAWYRAGEIAGRHQTLCVGLLYGITIITVLAVMARL